jgi:hypothetical protein
MTTDPLEDRVRKGLVLGKLPHSEGERIRASEDVTKIVVRWAETCRPAAAEEDLFWRHYSQFRRMPKHCTNCPALVKKEKLEELVRNATTNRTA